MLAVFSLNYSKKHKNYFYVDFLTINLELLVVLPLLLQLELDLLEPPLGLPEVLHVLRLPAVLAVKVGRQASNLGLQLLDQLLAAAQSVGLGLLETDLELLENKGSSGNPRNSRVLVIDINVKNADP